MNELRTSTMVSNNKSEHVTSMVETNFNSNRNKYACV